MALIKTITEVQEVLYVSNLGDDVALPNMDLAGEEFIMPKIGEALYDDIETKYNNNTLTPTEFKLLKKIQTPLAAYAFLNDLATLNTRLTTNGLRRMETTDMPSAFRWMNDEMKEFLLKRAMQGLESLYRFLSKTAFTLYDNSDAFKKRKLYLVKNGIEFSSYYFLYQPHRVYEMLYGSFDYVLDQYLYPAIGSAYYETLRDKANKSADELIVLEDLKKAFVYYSIAHATQYQPVKLSDAGWTIASMNVNDSGSSDKIQALPEQLDLIIKSSQRDGDLYLNKAKAYLNSKASATVFPEYFASSFYQAPPETPPSIGDKNKDRKNFYLL